MIPRLSSNDLQFWETMYSSGVPVTSSRGAGHCILGTHRQRRVIRKKSDTFAL